MILPAEEHTLHSIKIIGVGGGGNNAINHMVEENIAGVDHIAVNTDLQALEHNKAPIKVQIGTAVTGGRGTGADPELGRKAVLEDKARIEELIDGAEMVFIAAGMGGGTGTGAAPVVANIARSQGCLTVGVVTKPFDFEGSVRKQRALDGIEELKEVVDTLIVIPNERLFALDGGGLTLINAFKKVDEVLMKAINSISELINVHGFINVDFNDARKIMTNKGMALMGTGVSSGENRALEAARAAITSPLLEDVAIDGAMGVLINITCHPETIMSEIEQAVDQIKEEAHDQAEVIFGVAFDEDMADDFKITVIATGFSDKEESASVDFDEPEIAEEPKHEPVFVRTPVKENYGYKEVERSEDTTRIRVPWTASKHEITDRDKQWRIPAAKEIRNDVGKLSVVEEDRLDIPTFLRNQEQGK